MPGDSCASPRTGLPDMTNTLLPPVSQPTESASIFELHRVCKTFNGTKALHKIDLRIPNGCVTTIIGPSGCGKTVLLKHLIGLIRPDAGEVFFHGQRVDTQTESQLMELRRRCGFLFQAGALFDSQTVGENVAFPLIQHRRDLKPSNLRELVLQKLELVGLAHKIDQLPSELSGGQQKRVALARAVALEPEVILYDEPTTGLDPIRSETINELILKLQQELKITSIVVTHDMKSVYRVADKVVMLDSGEIIANGNVRDIRESLDAKVQGFLAGDNKAFAIDN